VISTRKTFSLCALLTLGGAILTALPARAAVRGDRLMSPTTRGFLSITDVQDLHQHWLRTQMGQLVQDEAMQPFVKDMKRQLQRKISGVREKLAMEWAGLKDVANGEIALGLVERENERAAIALTVNVAGHDDQLRSLLRKVDSKLTKRGATKSRTEQSGTEVTTYTIAPKKEGGRTRTAVYFVKQDMLCATDSSLEAAEMLARFDGGSNLFGVDAYQQTMTRCAKEAAGLVPQVRWYVDPFGYARSIRSLAPAGQERHGRDYLKILGSQGFEAVQGIGGFVNLAVAGSYELLHRTSIYAPPIPGELDKYRLAMRMMKFPNRRGMRANKWLPRKLATYRTFNWDLANAFQHFDTLFDAVIGYDEAFADVIEGLEVDAYGPQIRVQKDFVDHLGQQVILVTDYEVPITPKCERFLFVVELTNEEAIAATMKKYMDSDPNATQTKFNGKIVWEIQEAEEDIPDFDIASADLDLLAPVEEEEVAGSSNPGLPTSGVCVTDGQLFIASHIDFLKSVLAAGDLEEGLASAGDYREVNAALNQLLPGDAAVRTFMRTDEAFRPVYELLRQGKMPESETLLGRLLNRLLTPPDDEDEGILRQQKIDGRKLPDFEMVRRYFGPAGSVIRSDKEGWMIVGATLTKTTPQARATGAATGTQIRLR